MSDDGLNELQERLGVRFKDIERLKRALTHRSAATENSLDSNERLEFLGDSVVNLVVCENLVRLYPEHSEGDLAKSKAYVVSEPSLANAAQALGLEAFVVMSQSEAASGGRRRRSILSDAFEAVIAAVYLDAGIVAARRIVRNALLETMRATVADAHRGDYKSALQEQAQALLRVTPTYRTVAEDGREHEKTFTAEAMAGELFLGKGRGKSKKEAEQAAALDGLSHLPALVTPPSETVPTTDPDMPVAASDLAPLTPASSLETPVSA